MTNVKRVYIAHTINIVACSIVGVYIPAYLLTLGFPLSRVILFFVISHGVGLLFGLFIFIPLVQKWGLLNTFKLYYPLQIVSLLLLSLIKTYHIPPEIIALSTGLANFAYWLPLNIFFIKHSETKDLGSNLSKFFALPSIFSIAGPLLGSLFIPLVGFWPVFAITTLGIIASFIPLAGIDESTITVSLNFTRAWERLKRHKIVFLFEFFDNIIEESEWFWSIYVFLIIGSLTTPGIVGSMQAIGGSLFTLLVGQFANRYGKKLIPIVATCLLLTTILRIFIHQPVSAYTVTLVASFLLNAFLVSYFSTIYKTVKNDNEEEFMILREIPTVLGRMVVFAGIYLTISHLQYFFILPACIIALLLLLFVFKRNLLAS